MTQVKESMGGFVPVFPDCLHGTYMYVCNDIYDLHCIYRTRRNFRGGLIFVLFAGEVDPRKLMRTKMINYGPSP